VLLTLTQGRIQGSRSGQSARFLGIPYGLTTGGALRFRPPIAAPVWDDIRDCRAFGDSCPQINDDLPAWKFDGAHSADCLNLNVWMPADATPGDCLPVMVWLHGGAYLSGSANLPLYDGRILSEEQQVVVVSINHRLNAFGYLYLHDAEDGASSTANLGQQDIVLALEWIAANIAAFGGDPGNVTLFGESGGGGKICALTMMPSGRGLFHKAVIQSGAFVATLSRQQARERTDALLALLDDDVRALVDLPDERILAATRQLIERYGYTAFWPVDDGVVINASGGRHIAVPMMIGTTRHEAAYFLEPRLHEHRPLDWCDHRRALERALGPFSLGPDDAARAAAASMHADAPGTIGRDLTDILFWIPAMTLAERNSRHADTFMYRFDWEFACCGGRYSIHGAEIPFVFGTLDYALPAWDPADFPNARYAADAGDERFALAARMRRAWADFARFGDPSARAAMVWPRYTPNSRSTRIFDRVCRIEDDPDAARRRAWRAEHAGS
jgi:para-nitrobenzyl esterase